MPTNNKILSLKHIFITSIVSLTTLSFLVTASVTLYFIFSHLEKDFKQDIIERSAITSKTAKAYLISKDVIGLEKRLSRLSSISRMNTVHIYHLNNNQVSVTSSYNKDYTGNQGIRHIPSQINRKERLKSPQINGAIIEYIQPITEGNTIIGYVYLEMDLQSLQSLKNKTYLCLSVCFLFILCFSIFLATRLQNKVFNSVDSITTTVQKVSHKKAFDLRCEIQDYQEFELLARSINNMLARTEKHVKRQVDAEQQILKLNHELEDKVSQRTEALKDSNEELLSTLEKLHQFQGQLVESEKMASLGDMVAGVAHEVNTPIGLGVTASTLLSDRLDEIKECFDSKTLKSSQLKRFLADGQENIGIIYRNLNRAADLISSFKKVAVDQSSEEDRQFMVSELIDEVVLTLAPQLKNSPVTLEVDCPDELVITSKPGPINQILINLIVNSLIHAFDGQPDGTIKICIMVLSGQLHIQYKDNGKGVDQSVKNRIFDPFITTKRGEGGSGLGLHLVYNLVTQALNGSIQFDSVVNKGISFDIVFPVIIGSN
ncbi:HAMP domain-containing sensor histidine kinase [Thalassotalea atypica]|uniref:HAMP domain-containing sensor histidine kinase n=1 Tax=Thalassotalea atypica TaxID=2054316 RepID=UPI002573ACB1|nr:ATP-binding protein [Thalassotalea atypica]